MSVYGKGTAEEDDGWRERTAHREEGGKEGRKEGRKAGVRGRKDLREDEHAAAISNCRYVRNNRPSGKG